MYAGRTLLGPMPGSLLPGGISRPIFAVFPAYTDTTRITGMEDPLTDAEIKELARARDYAAKRLGKIEGFTNLDTVPPDGE